MTYEEFESILEEAFMEGYNSAYKEVEEAINETKTINKKRHIEIINKSKRLEPMIFKDKEEQPAYKSDEFATGINNGDGTFRNLHRFYVEKGKSGRIKDIRNHDHMYNLTRSGTDRLNAIMDTNKLIMNTKDPEKRKAMINKAKQTLGHAKTRMDSKKYIEKFFKDFK